jgi:hypothetical protein
MTECLQHPQKWQEAAHFGGQNYSALEHHRSTFSFRALLEKFSKTLDKQLHETSH